MSALPEGYEVTFDPARIDAVAAHAFLSQSYWAEGIPLDTVDKMKAALATGTAASKAAQFVIYPDTGHAFHADYRPTYRQGPADDGWKRCLAWFKANGVA